MIPLVLVVLVIAVSAYSVHAVFKYTRMISNIFLSLVYNPTSFKFSSCLAGEKITILDSSDKEIEALFVENKGSKKIVIFCHESGATKDSWAHYISFLKDLGFHVLSVDFGEKTIAPDANALSQWPKRADVQRLLTVIRWSKKAVCAHVQIVLFGVSNGADIAFAASFEDAAVKAVVADGLFSMKEIFRDYIRKWAPILVRPNLFGQNYPFWIVNTFANLGFWYCQRKTKRKFVEVEGLLKRKHVPLLMIHGQNDDYVPDSHQRFLEKMNADKNRLRRLVVANAKHNQAVMLESELYQKNVIDFVAGLTEEKN
ncbi:MAG: hypothetical protein COT00_04770 [Candidatus Omnitrophica bacterium CG07_land_8_20_14_0_80_50_8]|nr:MAG: hypothetical protein AUJ71_01295 [Candidatus Omnitrophica bacterium CG1_02_49_16]PIU39857.1 MAG: hypothetical protein COT00_04770 [Candidatus Omnitrophica bacterium CG07_land_8_20_14_0_80_50_8]